MSSSDKIQEQIDQVLQQEENAEEFATKVIFFSLGLLGLCLILSWLAPKIDVFNRLIHLMGGH